MTLQEKRALDRANIETLIKSHKHLLVPWQKIMARCLATKQPQSFLQLKSVDDFIDGF